MRLDLEGGGLENFQGASLTPARAARRYLDGGKLDRTFVREWRRWRGGDAGGSRRTALVHLVTDEPQLLATRDGIDDERSLLLVRTPRARAGLWSLGDFTAERAEARAITSARLLELEEEAWAGFDLVSRMR